MKGMTVRTHNIRYCRVPTLRYHWSQGETDQHIMMEIKSEYPGLLESELTLSVSRPSAEGSVSLSPFRPPDFAVCAIRVFGHKNNEYAPPPWQRDQYIH